jgi:hypothetical protein
MRTGIELLRGALDFIDPGATVIRETRDAAVRLRNEIAMYLDVVDGTGAPRPSLAPSVSCRIAALNPDERAVIESALDDLLSGLEKGREAYGPLNLAANDRDFAAEAREEQRDGMLYLAMERVRRAR